MFRYIAGLFLLMSIVSCRPRVFPPKPPGYFSIDTPAKHEYRDFNEPEFPYSFEYPTYSNITNDTVFQKGATPHPYWINVNFPGLNAAINVTYIGISARHPLDSLLSDAEGLSYFHDKKADYIDHFPFNNGHGGAGVIYVVGGNTASRYQFFATDSTGNFMRGSLYFDVTPNADSLKPATDFILQDIQHMLYTLRWKPIMPKKPKQPENHNTEGGAAINTQKQL